MSEPLSRFLAPRYSSQLRHVGAEELGGWGGMGIKLRVLTSIERFAS